MPPAPPPAIPALPFEEAVAWFQARVPVTYGAFHAMAETQRQKAFRVAGVAQLDLVQQVKTALDNALASGTTFADFKKEIGPKLEEAWAGSVKNPAWRIETIFRTNTQHAFAAGRYEQATDPAVAGFRPYWLYSAILDTRTTSICRSLDGKVLPADDPFWESHFPPCHFNCRSTFIALRPSQAERRLDPKAQKRKPEEAAKGFGKLPTPDPYEPDPEVYDEDILAIYNAKQKTTPPPLPAMRAAAAVRTR